MRFDIGKDIYLTTDHAASSAGVPVLVVNGKLFNPSDMLPHGKFTAGMLVRGWASLPLRTTVEKEAVGLYLGSRRLPTYRSIDGREFLGNQPINKRKNSM